MEIIRRLLLLIGLLGGVFACLYCRPVLISVAVEDFAESKAAAESRPTGFLYKDDTLEEFYNNRTEGRRMRVDDEAWMTFHEQVRSVTVDSTGDAAMLTRLGGQYSSDRLYYLPDEQPIDKIAGRLSHDRQLIYLQINADGPAAPTLVFVHHNASDLAGAPPEWLLRPYRPCAIWLIACGILFYLFLPRQKRRDDTIRCSGVHAIGLPDLLGALLAAVFFGLSILIIQMNGAIFAFPDGAWYVPIVICWFLALFPLLIMGIAAFNASLSVQLKENGLRIRRWNGTRLISFYDVEHVEAVEWRTPGWLRLLAWLVVLLAQRGVISALILEQGRGAGLEFHLRHGARSRIWISGLDGWDRIVEALDAQGVAIAPEVRAMCED